MNNQWTYKDKPFDTEDIPENAVGFVYEITCLTSDRKYIGKKNFYSKTRRPPLKGKKRKRTVIKESDWKDYYGSSENVRLILEEKGEQNFRREILWICYSKGDLSFMELYYQIQRNVLLDDKYFNGIIQCRINSRHLKNISINDLEKIN